MKKKWVEPRILVQQFVANEYVAASCYKIHCETPNNNDSYYYIITDSNGNGHYDSSDKIIHRGRFTGCNQWHSGVIQDNPPKANGFVAKAAWSGWRYSVDTSSVSPVFYWYENLGSQYGDIHVMTPGKESYETNPNAS